MSGPVSPPRDKQEIVEAINTLYAWHGGMSSAFYSFASTLKLWSEQHRQNCLAELKEVRFHAESVQDLADLANVESLIHYAVIGQEVCTREEWLGS